LRLDNRQFELRTFQARASPFGIAAAVVVNATLRCCDPVSCALQVRNVVLRRLWPRAFLSRSLRQLSGEDNGLGRGPSRHRASDYFSRSPDVFGLFLMTRLARKT